MCKLNHNLRKGNKGGYGARHQAGASLMETMISLALSLVVTTAMVTLMGNSMGSATRITQMSQLTDELRNAMSMMSRDVRRANFNTNSIYCYANSDCGVSGGPAEQYNDIAITGNTCFVFGLDRNWDGNSANDGPGAFRRTTSGGVGLIEMWTGTGAPNCGTAGGDWLPITDPDFVDITAFNVDDAASFSQDFETEIGTLTQRTRRVQMQIDGRLILDNTITRAIEDTVTVRNDFFN